jgi:hypothetical protein
VRLDEVVLKALENDPEMRFQRVSEVKSELDTISGQIDALPPYLRKMLGYEYKSKRTWLGLPLIHIVTRVDPMTGKSKEARGVFAFGGKACGVFAMGGVARGFIACGGVAMGVISVGGVSMGLLSYGGFVLALLMSNGGISIGPLAAGVIAIGLLAFGGLGISMFPISGPDASAFASWMKVHYFGSPLPIASMILANLCWVVPLLLTAFFRRKLEQNEPGS